MHMHRYATLYAGYKWAPECTMLYGRCSHWYCIEFVICLYFQVALNYSKTVLLWLVMF